MACMGLRSTWNVGNTVEVSFAYYIAVFGPQLNDSFTHQM